MPGEVNSTLGTAGNTLHKPAVSKYDNRPATDFSLAHWTALKNVKEHCVFIHFAAFASDKDLPHEHQYNTKVKK